MLRPKGRANLQERDVCSEPLARASKPILILKPKDLEVRVWGRMVSKLWDFVFVFRKCIVFSKRRQSPGFYFQKGKGGVQYRKGFAKHE